MTGAVFYWFTSRHPGKSPVKNFGGGVLNFSRTQTGKPVGSEIGIFTGNIIFYWLMVLTVKSIGNLKLPGLFFFCQVSTRKSSASISVKELSGFIWLTALCYGTCQIPTGKSFLASCFVSVCQQFYWIAVIFFSFLLGLRLVFQ